MIRRFRAWRLRHAGATKRRPLLTALVLVLVVAVPGYARLEVAVNNANEAAQIAQETADDLASFVVEQAEVVCSERRTIVQVLRQLVTISGAGGGFNPAAIPSFDAMPESVKTFFLDLASASSGSPDPGGFVESALKLLETVDCVQPAEVGIETIVATPYREEPGA